MTLGVGRPAAILFFAVVALVSVVASPRALQAQPNVTGQWQTLPYTMPINPIHVMLLRTGKVLIVTGSENDPSEHDADVSLAALWDLSTGTFTTYDMLWDLFCNGGAFLPDGRALIVGGTEAYDPFTGNARATVFDPITENFTQVESMAHGRWYATTTAMNDGRILTFSGYGDTGATINQAIEFYTSGSGWGPELQAPWIPPLYPWQHLLPNGTVFVSGNDPDSHIFDPATSTWTLNVARTVFGGTRLYGSSVLLPLTPPDYVPRIMIMGGNDPATASAEIIDLSQSQPQWRAVAPMSRPRIEMNATLLPNGLVLASGGSVRDEDATTASRRADLFNPATGTWSSAGTAAVPRLYHSVALLLPDATVMTAGSNPQRGVYDSTIEIWKPPYLFTSSGDLAPRPSVTDAPGVIGYGGSFQVKSPNAADIGSVVLVRPGSPTHAFDMEQRVVGLSFTKTGTSLTVSGPPTTNIVPPGYYMLFILNTSGVPSVARFLQVSATATNPPPPPITELAAAAVLPTSRSVQVGTPATAFATIINAGPGEATGCAISSLTSIPAALRFQTTDPATNAVTGSPNTPVDIPAGASQSFVFALTPSAPVPPTDVQLRFACANSGPAIPAPGINTLLFSASATPVPDIVAVSATLGNDGIVNLSGTPRAGFFAVATANVGISGAITASADTGGTPLPVTLTICQTEPTTGACLAPPRASVTTVISSGATSSFAVFVDGSGAVPFDPAANRVFVRFRDAGANTRGSTSVAVSAP
jgi:hypothetical protein